MSARIYLDWDFCAAPFSFNAQDYMNAESLGTTLNEMYDHALCARVRKSLHNYMCGELKPFLEKYMSRITILTANSEQNVKDILEHFDLAEYEPKIVSIFDKKAEALGRPDVTSNLFAAVVEYNKKVMGGKRNKTIEYVAEKFNNSAKASPVSVQDIRRTNRIWGSRILRIEQTVTKAAYIKAERVPFIFLDDSGSEIRSVQSLIDQGVPGIVVSIPRPGLKSPFEQCGMFSVPGKALVASYGHETWEAYMDEQLGIMDRGHAANFV